MSATIPAAVIGASGYVGGELLRLLAGHPHFEVASVVSNSLAGKRVGEAFGHLAAACGDLVFATQDGWLDGIDAGSRLALFSASPHGVAAAMLEEALASCARKNIEVHVVDCSADFRFAEVPDWERVYGHAHGAPDLVERFHCAVPEHVDGVPAAHIAHPGCFATAMLLAAVPLLRAGLVEEDLYVSAITGSTGSGKSPQPGTHHPERVSNLYAYKPLAHRHAPEVETLAAAASGTRPRLHFVPHSGPFARGIHATLQARASHAVTLKDIREAFDAAYANAPFVTVIDGQPRIKDVVASNFARIGVASDGETIVVMSVIDNLVKGAAGGAVQWMNRLWGFADSEGLMMPAPGWT